MEISLSFVVGKMSFRMINYVQSWLDDLTKRWPVESTRHFAGWEYRDSPVVGSPFLTPLSRVCFSACADAIIWCTGSRWCFPLTYTNNMTETSKRVKKKRCFKSWRKSWISSSQSFSGAQAKADCKNTFWPSSFFRMWGVKGLTLTPIHLVHIHLRDKVQMSNYDIGTQ